MHLATTGGVVLALLLSLPGFGDALSRSHFAPPEDHRDHRARDIKESHTFISSESLLNFEGSTGINATATSSDWKVEVSEGWHLWTRTGLYEGSVLPLWPPYLERAGIVVSTGNSRSLPLPASPEQEALLASPELEQDGIHAYADGRQDAELSNLMRAVWGDFLVAFAGEDIIKMWDRRDGHPSAAFIPVKDQALYYHAPLNRKTKSAIAKKVQETGSRPFDLARLSFPTGHFLEGHLQPQVFRDGRRVLDQVRLEVTLTRTHNGFIQIQVQIVSKIVPSLTDAPPSKKSVIVIPVKSAAHKHILPSSVDVQVLHSRKPDGDNGWKWEGQRISNEKKFKNSAISLKRTAAPSKSAGDESGLPDSITGEIKHKDTLHPKLTASFKEVSEKQLRRAHGNEDGQKCDLEIMFPLAQTHFFDPYQTRDLETDLGPTSHHGPVQLEFPTEEINAWGSMLWLHSLPHQYISSPSSPSLDIPFHTRYRLTQVVDELKSEKSDKVIASPGMLYDGYSIREQVLPPIAFWSCIGVPFDQYVPDGFLLPRAVPVILSMTHPQFYQLKKRGAAPYSIWPIRFELGNEEGPKSGRGSVSLVTPVPDPQLSDPVRWITSAIVASCSIGVGYVSLFSS